MLFMWRRIRRALDLVISSLLAFSAAGASAGIIDANVNGNWSDPATWVGGTVPGAGDTVRINVTVTVDVSTAACARLELGSMHGRYSSPGTILFSSPSATLSVSGSILLGQNPSSGVYQGYVTMSNGALSVGGNVTLNDGGVSASGGSIVYNGGTQSVASGTYFNLTFSGGSKNAAGNIIVKGDLTIMASASFFTSSYTHTVYGDWKNKGSVSGLGEIIFNGSSTQNIDGTDYFNNVLLANGPKIALGPLEIAGDLTIESSASLDAGTNTLLVQGNWICTGTFSAGTGTVNLSGNDPQVINGSTTFNNLILGGTGEKTPNSGVSIEGNLSILSGATLNGGSFTHTVKGFWTNDGTFNAGTGTVAFNGTGPQAIQGSAFTVFNHLRINNASGVTVASANVGVTSKLTLLSGNLSLGNTLLTLSPGAPITGAGADKFIVTNGTGSLVQEIAPGASLEFPVGPSGGSYNPVTLSLPAGDPTESFAVRVSPLSSSLLGISTLDTSRCVRQAWYVLEEVFGGNHVNVAFNWNHSQNGSGVGILDNAAMSLKAYLYDSGSKRFSPVADVAGTASSADPLTGSTSAPLTTFGFIPYVIGASTAPLPIQLVSFTAKQSGGTIVELTWQTLSEVNNYGFYVQRRGDSTSAWTDLPGAFLPGHGTTTEPNVYLYDDRQAGPGSWQYRLRQVDNDGTAHFSEAIAVNLVTSVEQANIPTAFALDQNFPNPFNPSAVIRYAVAGARGQGLGTSHVRLVVYDLLGREVAVLVDENKAPGNYEVTFSAANLASGVYFCRLVAGEFVAVRKMTLAR